MTARIRRVAFVGDNLRRVVLAERPVGPVERLVRRVSQVLLGHMILTVVRPR